MASGELSRIAPAAAALAEAAWLADDPHGVDMATGEAFELAVRRRAAWHLGELGYWRWRAGLESGPPDGAAEPYALQMSGDWRRAAQLWAEIGCPYEAALALAEGEDEDAVRHARDTLRLLGAQPAADIVSLRLGEPPSPSSTGSSG